MLWCARKAFFGHVPFPLVTIDTGKKFPEVYEFRDRLIKEWKLDCIIGKCPPVEEMDPTLPPAARSAARKTAGLNAMLAREGFDGLIAGIRRDEEGTRAKERVFSPRGEQNTWNFRDQPPEFWDQFNTDFRAGHPPARPPAAALDRAGHLALHQAREHPADQPVLRQERQAVPLAGRQGHHLPGRLARRYHRRHHRGVEAHQGVRAVPGGRWITRRRILRAPSRRRLHVGERRAARWTPTMSKAAESAIADDRAAEDRHRRPRRPRQVDPGRPPVPRHRLAAGGQGRSGPGDERKARHALRVGVPAGRAAGRARPGHHHRHLADLLPHRRCATTC